MSAMPPIATKFCSAAKCRDVLIGDIVRLLFCVLVAGPDKILLGRKSLSLLLDPKLPFGDMADHGIHHRGTHGLRSRLHDDVTQLDVLKTGMIAGVSP